jgi:hypothetical protein
MNFDIGAKLIVNHLKHKGIEKNLAKEFCSSIPFELLYTKNFQYWLILYCVIQWELKCSVESNIEKLGFERKVIEPLLNQKNISRTQFIYWIAGKYIYSHDKICGLFFKKLKSIKSNMNINVKNIFKEKDLINQTFLNNFISKNNFEIYRYNDNFDEFYNSIYNIINPKINSNNDDNDNDEFFYLLSPKSIYDSVFTILYTELDELEKFDFSHGRSFYFYFDLNQALFELEQYNLLTNKSGISITIYKFPIKLLLISEPNLIFNEIDKNWFDCLEANHFCNNAEYKKYKWILGPKSCNTLDIQKPMYKNPIPQTINGNLIYQLCIKDGELFEKISKYIHSYHISWNPLKKQSTKSSNSME